MKFKVDIEVRSQGSLEVEAKTSAEARQKVMKLEEQIEIHFPSFVSDDIDTTAFDGFVNVDIEEIEPIIEAAP